MRNHVLAHPYLLNTHTSSAFQYQHVLSVQLMLYFVNLARLVAHFHLCRLDPLAGQSLFFQVKMYSFSLSLLVVVDALIPLVVKL